MRLLHYGTNGVITLATNWSVQDKVPPYAILSHTWHEGEEVTYDDMVKLQGQNRRGYEKLRFCAQRARLDNLDYFWVDTCCIDKSSSAEVAMEINSMFKRYRDAARCYVYLSDVASTGSISTNTGFPNSRWFKRGWTLQELIAPSIVEFFTKDGALLGDKHTLERHIANITGIPLPVLQGHPLVHYTYDERLSWSQGRITKYEEDAAYSLLGIMDVYLSPIYGELRRNALRRLRCEFNAAQAELKGEERAGNVHWTVHRTTNSLFTGRLEVIQRVVEAFRYEDLSTGRTKQRRLVIAGVGGQGKSEVALQIATLLRENFWGVFWVDVGHQSTARLGFAAISRALGASADTNEDALRTLTSATRRWLLILDNADDPDHDYATYFPTGDRGAVIMTTRVPECRRYSTVEPEALGGLNDADAKALLLKAAQLPKEACHSDASRAQVLDVVRLIDSHPLALLHAGSYIAEGYCRLGEYADIYRRQRTQILKHHVRQEQSRYQNVYATFEASVEALSRSQDGTGTDALRMLGILSMLHHSPLSLQLFRDAWSGAKLASRQIQMEDVVPDREPTSRLLRLKPPWRRKLKPRILFEPPITKRTYTLNSLHAALIPGFLDLQLEEWNDYRLKKSVALLSSLSLVNRQISDECDDVSMHPLVHAWAKDRLQPQQHLDVWISAACLVTSSLCQSNFWRSHELQLLPHVQNLMLASPRRFLSPGSHNMMLSLAVQCGWALHAVRDYQGLQHLLDRLYRELETAPQSLSLDHPPLCVLAARAALHLKNTRLAVMLLEQVTSIYQTTLSETDSRRLGREHDLARAYNDNNEAPRAIPVLEHIIEMYKLLPPTGDNAAWLSTSQYELTRAYNMTNQSAQAVVLLKEMVDAPPTTSDLHDRLRTQHALAIAYTENDQPHEAIIILEKVVNSYETLLPPIHPDRLFSQRELARAYVLDNQPALALPVALHIVDIQQESLDEKDQNLLASQYALSHVHRTMGQYREALKLREHVVSMYRETMHEEQPERLRAEYALALSYRDVGEPERGVELIRGVVEVQNRMGGGGNGDGEWRTECERLLRELENS